MSGPDRSEPSEERGDDAPADEEYARTYAAGYEEGVRTALREVLAHASRGRTNQELRALVQSRLARLGEEVELKRRGLLTPPRPRPFGELLRPTAGFPAGGGGQALPRGGIAPLHPGASVLVREPRPERAVDILLASRTAFPRLVIVSLRPPELPKGAEETIVVPVRDPKSPGGTSLTAGELAGRLRGPMDLPGGALVYLDALELLVTAEGSELVLRFARFLIEQVQHQGSALLVSYDPHALTLTDASRLERLFGEVIDRSSAARAPAP